MPNQAVDDKFISAKVDLFLSFIQYIMVRKEIKKAAICSIPAYCLRGIGSRHILVGGGGGSAKTGVANQLQVGLCFRNEIYCRLFVRGVPNG